MSRQRLWLFWSSGKDSAWALHVLRRRPDIEVSALVVTVHEALRQVAVHATPLGLLERQCSAAGLPLRKMDIPHPCPNPEYEAAIRALLRQAASEHVDGVAFGDLRLSDVRAYREGLFKGTGITPVFPLWQADTGDLASRMVSAGLRAIVTCVDPGRLPGDHAGRVFDASFLDALPADVDPCGENGEFHTFAFDGPMFRRPVGVAAGRRIHRDGFVFADLEEA